MTSWKYIWRSFLHFRKQHLALFLGMAISAAVLTGALIVGDSIRYSLGRMVDTRLGKTQFALTGGSRYMDIHLAGSLAKALQVPVSPLLMLQGIVIEPDSGIRVNKAFVMGIDSSFNNVCAVPSTIPGDEEAVVGKSLADRLGVQVGDELLIRVESASLVPVDAPFAQEPTASTAFRKTIVAIAGDDQCGRFSLGNAQSTANNVFVSLHWLGQKLDLDGLSNTLLITGDGKTFTPDALHDSIQKSWTMKDLGLSVRNLPGTDNYDLVSNRIFIDTVVEKTLSEVGLPHQEVITYLINDIECKGKHTPYSFASALPFTLSGHHLQEDEVIINQWTADDLGAVIGDSVTLTYYEIGALRKLRETSHRFVILDIMPDTSETINNSMMPDFQGMSEAGSCSEWDAGVPVDLKRIRDKDEAYWDKYRGTPKVILSSETGRKLWKNPFGSVTMIRFNELQVPKQVLSDLLLKEIPPSAIGLQAVDVRMEGNRTVENAVNFTELFLGMSFFIIVAGILLTVLIYSLHATRRSVEISLLSGLGFPAGKIHQLRLAETSLVILFGSIAGSLLGILYNRALLAALNTVWNDIVRTDMLLLQVKPGSIATGIVISIVIAVLPIYLVTIKLFRQSVASQIKGHTPDHRIPDRKRSRLLSWGMVLLVLSILLVLVSLVTASLNNATLYLSAAALVLAGSFLVVFDLLKRRLSQNRPGMPSLRHVAFTNLQRNTSRSMSVIALLAMGTFTIVLTGAYRKTFYGTEELRKSGTGGYLLWTETTTPVPFDLNSGEGEARMISESPDALQGVRFLQFKALDGDEASCLNLNQVNRPRILAIHAAAFDSAGAFAFIKKLPAIPDDHPWLGLDKAFNDSTFPAYVDQTVLQYSLQRKLGDTLVYQGETGRPFRLVLAGTLNNTIFQGNILIADTFFRRFYPSAGGTRVMLVDAPPNSLEAVAEMLSRSLVDYGIDITPTSQRLATFKTVENTYLTVFMALSGLGFIIGTIGLGIVLLRNIYERRKELALLLSIGYRKQQVFRLVFIENLYLLVMGWGIGMLAAFMGILPSLFSPAFDLQGGSIIVLTLGIFISGLLWIYFPLRSALGKPLMQALRNE
jgi:ABC-type antimicrobial peptide transport system permease subunit